MEDAMRKTLKTLLVAVAVCGILSGATAVASEPDGVCVEVVRKDWRIVQVNDVYAEAAWLVELENNCDNSFEFRIEGQFVDDAGFTIQTYRMYDAYLEQGSTQIFSGLEMGDPGVSRQIDGVRFRFTNAEVR
jgi:hypothetical protein